MCKADLFLSIYNHLWGIFVIISLIINDSLYEVTEDYRRTSSITVGVNIHLYS